MARRNVAHMPVMAVQCKTCPFRRPPSDSLRQRVEGRLLAVSQTCHSTGVSRGKRDTHLCRGARDFQLTILCRMGLLAEPTDAAWSAKVKELGL